MAYISYKYPFNNEKGEVTKAARIFGFLVILSIIAGGLIIFDSYNTRNRNNSDQQALKDTIGTISSNLERLKFSIDSLGYKRDSKTGNLVLKNPKPIENSVVVKSGNPVVQQNSVKAGKPLIQQNKEGDNQANSNTGVNNGSIGNGNNNHIVSGNGNKVDVNGDVINGIKQRHLTTAEYYKIYSKIPSLDSKIEILFSGGKEGINYANEIYRALMSNGFKNITGSNWMDPEGFDSVGVDVNGNNVMIKVYPASNVQ